MALQQWQQRQPAQPGRMARAWPEAPLESGLDRARRGARRVEQSRLDQASERDSIIMAEERATQLTHFQAGQPASQPESRRQPVFG